MVFSICVVSLYRIPKMANISLSDAPCMRIIQSPNHRLTAKANRLPGSDVQPCVWAIVESCVAIFCACLPTFPALFHMKSVRDNQKPCSDPRSIPSLTRNERRSGYQNSATNSCEDFLRRTNWAERPPTDKGSVVSRVHGETDSV